VSEVALVIGTRLIVAVPTTLRIVMLTRGGLSSAQLRGRSLRELRNAFGNKLADSERVQERQKKQSF
jgi:hypothetical protein